MRTLQQFRILAALAQHRHFGRAAEELRLSQPALTKSLKAIEADLGVRVFDRGPPVTPTPIGQRVIAHAERLASRFEELKRELALARGLDTGSLTLSFGGQVAELVAIDAVGAFSRKHPFVSCIVQIGDHESVTADVLDGRADLGVADLSAARGHPELETETLRRTGYVLFCRHGHRLTLPGANADAAALLAWPWVGTSRIVPGLAPVEGRHAFGDVDTASGRIALRLRVNTFSATLRLVMASDAISAAPHQLIAPHVALGTLAVLREPYGWPDLEYGIIRKRGRTPSPAAEAYMTELRRIEAALGAAA